MRRYTDNTPAAITVRGEPAFSMLSHLALLTLAVYYDEGPNTAILADARKLRQEGTTPSAEFNAIFGHGFGLRDTLAILIDPGEPVLSSIDAFVRFLDAQNEFWWRSLTELSVYTGLDFADAQVMAAQVLLDADLPNYAQAIAYDESEANIQAIANHLTNPGTTLKQDVLRSIEIVRNLYSDSEMERLAYGDRAATAERATRHGDVLQAFTAFTGRPAPHTEQTRLLDLAKVTFLMVPCLGPELSISYFEDHAVVAFEPAASSGQDNVLDAAPVFDALSHPHRLGILDLLSQRGEMYGLAIAEALEIPQASLSNHLSVLGHARLIGTRPAGRRIYYSITREGFDLAMNVLRRIGGAS